MAKMHMRPFDDTVYMSGWYDYHHAGGPAVWSQSLYKSPDDYYNRTTNKAEIVYWGEEGAISTPPRLAKSKKRSTNRRTSVGTGKSIWIGMISLMIFLRAKTCGGRSRQWTTSPRPLARFRIIIKDAKSS